MNVTSLEKLLAADPVFSEYHVVKVVGDGSSNEDEDAAAKKNFDRVKQAIATHDKTITLTVGQLTVGVTVPEWSGVLMLCNLKSPSSYMQAAFRAQNPCMLTVNGETFQKETAYVFDFDPARTLIIFDDFANNLNADTVNGRGTTEERKLNCTDNKARGSGRRSRQTAVQWSQNPPCRDRTIRARTSGRM
jgi:type I site-specific restriction endonuclease